LKDTFVTYSRIFEINLGINLMHFIKINHYWIFLLLLTFACSQPDENKVIPNSSSQMILVLTDSTKATKGELYYFDRNVNEFNWKISSEKIPVVLGSNGLGWGNGLHNSLSHSNFPIKKEGDGRSPAGVFNLSSVFGYKSSGEMSHLKMPYIHITEMVECIDDANSKFYNRIVSRDDILKDDSIDWQSSEKMRFAEIYYELGVVVDHNTDPIQSGTGSCIFLHNWMDENETMAGCTAMDPFNMEEIINWLDETKNPVLVQLTKQLYSELQINWILPELITDKK
jgi:D-alanyl-D-alanine dipeptidase